MIKEYGNMRKHKKKNTGRLKKNKKCIVRKYELLNDTLFLMSNLEGFGIFIVSQSFCRQLAVLDYGQDIG